MKTRQESLLTEHVCVCTDSTTGDEMPVLKRQRTTEQGTDDPETSKENKRGKRRATNQSGCPNLIALLTMTIITIMSCIGPATSTNDVRRLSQGVMFQTVKEVDVTSEVWKSTFLIEIPRDIRTMGHKHHHTIVGDFNKRIDRSNHDIWEKSEVGGTPGNWWTTCLAMQDTHEISNQRRSMSMPEIPKGGMNMRSFSISQIAQTTAESGHAMQA